MLSETQKTIIRCLGCAQVFVGGFAVLVGAITGHPTMIVGGAIVVTLGILNAALENK